MGDSSKRQLLLLCYHCGNKGLLNVVGEHEKTWDEYDYDEYGRKCGLILAEEMKWSLLECPVCGKVTLFEEYSNSEGEYYDTEEVLYPANRYDSTGVPEFIESSFNAALKVKQIDSAICLLSLRRTLEAICKDKKAEGNNLEKKIEYLINKGVLPSGLEDACWVIRQLGNDAAHADNAVFYTSEVNQVISFVELILEYLYSAPIKMNKLKERIDNMKSKKNNREAIK